MGGRVLACRIGSDNYPVAVKGRAWIVADSYQILRLQTDLIASRPEIRLAAEHTDIQYGPVHFASRAVDMWLPQTAEVYTDFRKMDSPESEFQQLLAVFRGRKAANRNTQGRSLGFLK